MASQKPGDYRYVGHYGRGHHKAYCSGIGEIYYGQIVNLTQEQIDNAPRSDWILVGNFCRHTDLGGNLCFNNREEGLPYCHAHGLEFKMRAQVKEEKPKQKKNQKVEKTSQQ